MVQPTFPASPDDSAPPWPPGSRSKPLLGHLGADLTMYCAVLAYSRYTTPQGSLSPPSQLTFFNRAVITASAASKRLPILQPTPWMLSWITLLS